MIEAADMPLGQRVPVLTVGGDNRILRPKRFHDSDAHRFLTDIEMHESADLLLRIEFRTFFLKTPDPQHFAEQVHPVDA